MVDLRIGRVIEFFLACVVSIFASSVSFSQTLDSTWTLSIAGQTVRPNADGSFFIPNVAAPDEFGNVGGPGTVPDFRSDDPLRVTGRRVVDGKVEYVWSDLFYIAGRVPETVRLDTLYFSDRPPPVPVAVRLFADDPVLTEIGQTTQLRAIGRQVDGTDEDLVAAGFLPVFRNSASGVLTVSAGGEVKARAEGFGFVTVVAEGVTAVTRVVVAPGAQTTTLRGFVVDENGLAVPGAVVRVGVIGTEAVTDGDGRFDISGLPTDVRTLGLIVEAGTGGNVMGFALGVELEPGGITDAGVITVRRICEVLDGCEDRDDDCIPDALEAAFGYSADNADSDGDLIPDGLEDFDGDGLGNCAELFLGTDPLNADGDGDGLRDDEELFLYATNPNAWSSDGDFLSDGEEVLEGADGFISDPWSIDGDGDGWDDSTESFLGSNPGDLAAVPPLFDPDAPESYAVPVATARVSYLAAFAVEAGDEVTVWADSLLASYLNTELIEPGEEVTVWADSLLASYLNVELIEPDAEVTVWADSPLASYLNAEALEVEGEVPVMSRAASYLNEEEDDGGP